MANGKAVRSGKLADKVPELLGDLADTIADRLVRSQVGITPERAVEIGIEVADHMRGHWGGTSLYFPTGESINISRKWMQIYEEFNGFNHYELHQKHGLTLVHIYRIIKLVGAEIRRQRQGSLFPEA